MVIGFTLNDGARPIELLNEEEPHHLVREGHFREREFFVGTFIDIAREAVGTTYDEHQPTGVLLGALKPLGKIHAPHFLAVLVEQYHIVGGLKVAFQQFGLLRLLLLSTKVFGVFQLGNNHQLERHIPPHPTNIVGDARLQMLVGRFTYEDEGRFQSVFLEMFSKDL